MKYSVPPTIPNETTASNTLKRLIDGMGMRFYIATKGIKEDLYDFKPTETAMSAGELLKHMYQLVFWSGGALGLELKYDKSLDSVEGYTKTIFKLIEDLSELTEKMTDKDLDQVTIYLKRADKNFPFWYLINGPLADFVSHTGQLLTYRRMNGNPCERISPFALDEY